MTRPKLRPPPPPRNWRDFARCVGVDPEAFYPTDQAGANYAIRICLDCDVMLECLDDAVARGEKHAVRGGRRFGPVRAETVDGEQDSDANVWENETAPEVRQHAPEPGPTADLTNGRTSVT